MTNAAPQQQYTLPHTQITLPSPVTVSDYQAVELTCGLAYAATLSINGIRVGTIENQGTGGDTWLHTTNTHRPAWEALVAGARSQDGAAMDEETLAEHLVTEAEFTEAIRSVGHSRKRYVVRLIEEHAIYSGEEVHSTFTVRVPRTVEFTRAVTITPEMVPAVFGRMALPEEVQRADAYAQGQWVRFYSAQ